MVRHLFSKHVATGGMLVEQRTHCLGGIAMEAVQKAAGCFRFGQATAMFLIEGIGNILDLLEQVLLALSQEQDLMLTETS